MATKYPSYMRSEPTCCKEHRALCRRKRHIDVSGWKCAPVPDRPALTFDPFGRETQTGRGRARGLARLEGSLDELRDAALFGAARAAFRETPSILKDVMEEETTDGMMESPRSSSASEKEVEQAPERHTVEDVRTNPYLTLLNKLDEEEGKRAPSIEDKLKLMENRLRVAMVAFCKHSTQLASLKEGDAEEDDDDGPDKVGQGELFIQPDAVQELFRAQVFEVSPCPPVPFEVREMEPPLLAVTKKTHQREKEWNLKEKKMQEKFKQGYYLPPDTWFASPKEERLSITPEEIDLFNSFSTNEFLKFLDERKMEPPKALKKLQEKIKKLQGSVNEPEAKQKFNFFK